MWNFHLQSKSEYAPIWRVVAEMPHYCCRPFSSLHHGIILYRLNHGILETHSYTKDYSRKMLSRTRSHPE